MEFAHLYSCFKKSYQYIYMNYQPASWDPDMSGQMMDAFGGYSGGYGGGYGGYDRGSYSHITTGRDGRRYRCHCVPIDPPRPRPGQNLNYIARLILGRQLQDALRIYSNIRVVIRDGQRLIVTQDYQRTRINVETRNNVIIRIVGFY